MQYLGAKGFKEKAADNILPYYEYVYDKEGNLHTDFHKKPKIGVD